MSEFATMPVKDVTNLDGVKDLKMGARVKFAKALISEAKGMAKEADTFLTEAIAAL
jgi:hypothetical protein